MAIVTDVIHSVHTVGLTHGNLTASNILIQRRTGGTPIVQVVDFGLRRGTPADDRAAIDTLAVAVL
jgi:tRNA A-37 threonylcarbamoyl transferase component Bud32